MLKLNKFATFIVNRKIDLNVGSALKHYSLLVHSKVIQFKFLQLNQFSKIFYFLF